MVWQDFVFFIGQWIFIIALIPTLRAKEKPQISTSLVTAVTLAVFAVTYFTLGLWLSATASASIAGAWFILAVQKHKIDKKNKRRK